MQPLRLNPEKPPKQRKEKRWVLEYTMKSKHTKPTKRTSVTLKQKYATEKAARQAEEVLKGEGGVWRKDFWKVISTKIYEI